MRIVAIAVMVMMLCGVGYAKDITLSGIPDGITDEQVKEWCSILIERYENAKINAIPEVKTATETARTAIDGFRKANDLTPKFEKVAEPPIEAPVE